MDFKTIKAHILSRVYLFSDHADEERIKDNLTVADIEETIVSGDVIEERLDDPRGESRLIAGTNKLGERIHVVIGLRFGIPVIVTVYRPSQEEWESGKMRKR